MTAYSAKPAEPDTESTAQAVIPAGCAALPGFINGFPAPAAGLSCRAAPVDFSFAGQPTLKVAVTQDGQAAAVYKMNMLDFPAENILAFSPLVVTWAETAAQKQMPRPPGTGRHLMAHCTGWLSGAQAQGIFGMKKILLTTGNLTAARAGLPFFTALGWDIVRQKAAPPGALRDIADRLQSMAAPFQAAAGTEATGTEDDISYACRWFAL
jgi:hypothetical protein